MEGKLFSLLASRDVFICSWLLTFRQCDTDLPSSLRLGEVQVSCEGWSRPGDTFVVKGNHR
jgi:hypothetical protein